MTTSAPFVRLPLPETLDPASLLAGGSLPLSVERASQDVLLHDIIRLRSLAAALPPPLLAPSDCGGGGGLEKYDTLLEGETISCFIVGGEKRLCFPQVLSLVLTSESTSDINKVMTQLEINLARCNCEQLEVLKGNAIIPRTHPSCGLITKSDSERLVSHLLHANKPRPRLTPSRQNHNLPPKGSIQVEHDCVGGCVGHFIASLYNTSTSECIECATCGDVYAPDKFVLHSHQPCSRRTCHWGLDSANWRDYLHVCLQEANETTRQLLAKEKLKFDPAGAHLLNKSPPANGLKRKADQSILPLELLPSLAKRLQFDTAAALTPVSYLMSSYEPLIHAYYNALLAKTYNSAPVDLSSVGVPNVSLPTLPHNCSSSSKAAAAAAASLLALSASTSLALKASPVSPPTTVIASNHNDFPKFKPRLQPPQKCIQRPEPLKKHILQQYEEQLKRASNASSTSASTSSPISPNDNTCVDVESESTSSASEGADDENRGASLDSLLRRYIAEDDGLKIVRTRIAQSQSSLERQVDSLTSQNLILQQEISILRSKCSS